MASEVFITRRTYIPTTGYRVTLAYLDRDKTHFLEDGWGGSWRFIVPRDIAHNAIKVMCVGAGEDGVYTVNNTGISIAGGGSGEINTNIFINYLTPGERIAISPTTISGASSFGTYLSANKGAKASITTTTVNGGNGGAGGGAFSDVLTAYGGIGYQFGGGGSSHYGGNGGTWGGGGAGNVKGGKGGTYGGGGGSLTTGGAKGTYGGAAGQSGTTKPAGTWDYTFNIIRVDGSIGAHRSTGEAHAGTCADIGNKQMGGGGYGGVSPKMTATGNTIITGGAGYNGTSNYFQSAPNFNLIGGGSGYHTIEAIGTCTARYYINGGASSYGIFVSGGASLFSGYYNFYNSSANYSSFNTEMTWTDKNMFNKAYTVTGGSTIKVPFMSASEDTLLFSLMGGQGGGYTVVELNRSYQSVKNNYNISNLPKYITIKHNKSNAYTLIQYYQYG